MAHIHVFLLQIVRYVWKFMLPNAYAAARSLFVGCVRTHQTALYHLCSLDMWSDSRMVQKTTELIFVGVQVLNV
jgi:hypothetical protein